MDEHGFGDHYRFTRETLCTNCGRQAEPSRTWSESGLCGVCYLDDMAEEAIKGNQAAVLELIGYLDFTEVSDAYVTAMEKERLP